VVNNVVGDYVVPALCDKDSGGVPPQSADVMDVIADYRVVVVFIPGPRPETDQRDTGTADVADLARLYSHVDGMKIEAYAGAAGVNEAAFSHRDPFSAANPEHRRGRIFLFPVVLHRPTAGAPRVTVAMGKGESLYFYIARPAGRLEVAFDPQQFRRHWGLDANRFSVGSWPKIDGSVGDDPRPGMIQIL
jgi:hypothetical protein